MLSMYKPGQGYWTRLMTAIGAGTLAAAGAMWAWGQLSTIDPPRNNWVLTLEESGDAEGFNPGAQVELFSGGVDPAVMAFVVGPGDASGTVMISQLQPTIVGEGSAATTPPVSVAMDGIETLSRAGEGVGNGVEVSSTLGIPAFNVIYLQGGVAGALMLILGGLTYWFCYSSKKFGDFLIATEGEMKKVNWSTRKEVTGSTIVVIFVAFLITAVIFASDFLLQTFFRWIDIIKV